MNEIILKIEGVTYDMQSLVSQEIETSPDGHGIGEEDFKWVEVEGVFIPPFGCKSSLLGNGNGLDSQLTICSTNEICKQICIHKLDK